MMCVRPLLQSWKADHFSFCCCFCLFVVVVWVCVCVCVLLFLFVEAIKQLSSGSSLNLSTLII